MPTIRNTLTLAALIGLVACDDPQTPTVEYAPTAEEGLAAGLDLPPPLQQGLLPKYETAAERAVKDDSIDYRASYSEIYGITRAPTAARAIAEFEPTDGVVVAWAGELSEFFLDLTDAIAQKGQVYMVTPSLGYTNELRRYLSGNGVDTNGIEFIEYPHEAFWARDYGPWAVETAAGAAWIDPRYYPERRRDDALPTLLAWHLDVDVYRPDLDVEGGNFMTNGDGFCAVTEWLLQQNPGKSRREVEATLRDYVGCEQLLVVERLYGEGTGHIDMFAKFTSPDTVLVGEYDARAEPTNAALLDRNAEMFERAGFRVVRIPMPQADWDVYRSYTNSLFVNNTVLLPTYDTDRRLEAAAVDAYRKALPAGWNIVKVDASEVIYYGGAVHCVTMNFNRSPIGTRPPAPNLNATQPEPEPAGETINAASDERLPIQDLRRTTSTVQVAQSQQVSEVEVTVSIAHTYVGDLLVYLEHDGQKAVLHEFGGGGADNLERSYTTGAFAGADSAGEWHLVVEDHARQDQGTLHGWSLSIQ